MTAEGIRYIAAVAASTGAVICAGVAFRTFALAWVTSQRNNRCESCNGVGYHEEIGTDGRLTGGRYHCECQRLGQHVDIRV